MGKVRKRRQAAVDAGAVEEEVEVVGGAKEGGLGAMGVLDNVHEVEEREESEVEESEKSKKAKGPPTTVIALSPIIKQRNSYLPKMNRILATILVLSV